MKQKLALFVGAILGAAAGLFLRRRRSHEPTADESPDPRAEELRRRLAEAREARGEENDFEAAGMSAETAVAEEEPPPRVEPPPRDEFEAMRRRVHQEARAAAEEMRRRAADEEQS